MRIDLLPAGSDGQYPLKEHLHIIRRTVNKDGKKMMSVYALGSFTQIVGFGNTSEEALEDFCLQVHQRIQTLRKPNREHTAEDAAQMKAFARYIDFDAYEKYRPIQIDNKTATVVSLEPPRIQWEDGRVETVDFRIMTDSFAGAEVGDEFAITGHIDQQTGDLVAVFSANGI
jgi:hypothetical protein